MNLIDGINKKDIHKTALRIKCHLLAALLHQQEQADKKAEISLQQFIEMIRCDLSVLLNTSRSNKIFSKSLVIINHSLYSYGVPDFSLYDPNSSHDREEARKIIQQVIEIHEPRLNNVYVSTLTNFQRQAANSLNYRIEAEIVLLESRLHITLDSSIVPDSEKVFIHPPEVSYAR